ncbi:MAG: DinB family protein [Gemmatimonadales bacterium]|nr:DinB family protein [Gemmatimonadales bacterium]
MPRLIPLCAAVGFVLTLGGAPLPAQAPGPDATPAMLRTEYLANMKAVEDKIVSLAEAIPAEKYGWRPAEGVRSIAEVLMHVASEHYVYLPMSIGSKPPADLNMGTGREAIIANLDKVTAKTDVIKHLKASFAYQQSILQGADAVLSTGKVPGFGRERSVLGNFNIFIADQHEHLGQLIAYARMNGVVPPWSKKPA